jgi:hypothetical protein
VPAPIISPTDGFSIKVLKPTASLQDPPLVVEDKVMVANSQTVDGPVMAAGVSFTVTTRVSMPEVDV